MISTSATCYLVVLSGMLFLCGYVDIQSQLIPCWPSRVIFCGCSVPPQFQNFSDLSPELTRSICAQTNLQFSASSEPISSELTFWNYYGSAKGAWRGYPGRVCTRLNLLLGLRVISFLWIMYSRKKHCLCREEIGAAASSSTTAQFLLIEIRRLQEASATSFDFRFLK